MDTIVKKNGFTVLTALGNKQVQEYGMLTPNDFKNYYEFTNKNTIQFRTFDDKRGLYDKSIKLPAKWILEETDYEYYFRNGRNVGGYQVRQPCVQ